VTAAGMNGTLHLSLVFAFWGAFALLIYTFVGYPLWIYLCSRLVSRAWRREPIFPTVSVVLAVHNGATLVRRQIRRLLSLDYPLNLLDLIVVSDGSTDGTDKIISSIRHPAVKVIALKERRGKAAAVNVGLQNSTGEIVLFVDIRPWPARDSLKLLVSNFADPQIGCVTGELILRDEGHTAGARAVGGLYWRYERWIRKCESLVDSPLGVYGGFYAIRRELARPLPDATVLDDMLQPLSVIRQGYRSVIDDRARVHDVWPKSLRAEFNRKVRTLAGNFQLLQLAPWLLSSENRVRFELVSHKLLRLVVPVLLVVMLAAGAALAPSSPFFALTVIVQLLLYLLGFVTAWGGLSTTGRIGGAARAFCIMNLAVVVGFYKFVSNRGPLWKIWIPTASFPTVPSKDDDEPTQAVAGA
jgi:cellulose synthase/poly-beta-1,6-N-acetylglucosamine synthase-like glycosyltransferase